MSRVGFFELRSAGRVLSIIEKIKDPYVILA